ncbi:TetR/AcrR family transcriptional regulator [Rhodococcus sovatensis]|uniref:TetR family transcriptional regulator n=1 Tax=Rhodococcus sovatensis TaxID=1805840 RepID=A0ABZ2PET9_9NOCA
MEKSTRDALLDAGLDLLGRVGFRGWSMRGVEDEAGVPHGSARHHFANQHGLVLNMVRHLLSGDRPRPGETPQDRIARWIEPELGRTRARYELIVASFHDAELAAELVRGRDQLITAVIEETGIAAADAAEFAAAMDGLLLDALLRRQGPNSIDARKIMDLFRHTR